jgi:di/tricarboxylate transporter
MAFSSGGLRVMDLFKPGVLVTVVGMVLVFTVGYWWWRLIGFV